MWLSYHSCIVLNIIISYTTPQSFWRNSAQRVASWNSRGSNSTRCVCTVSRVFQANQNFTQTECVSPHMSTLSSWRPGNEPAKDASALLTWRQPASSALFSLCGCSETCEKRWSNVHAERAIAECNGETICRGKRSSGFSASYRKEIWIIKWLFKTISFSGFWVWVRCRQNHSSPAVLGKVYLPIIDNCIQ